MSFILEPMSFKTEPMSFNSKPMSFNDKAITFFAERQECRKSINFYSKTGCFLLKRRLAAKVLFQLYV